MTRWWPGAASGALVAGVVVLIAAATGSPRYRPRPPALDRRSAQVTGAPSLGRFTIGRSVVGRRIDAFERSAPGATGALLVFGCVDGNEPAGIAIARRLMTLTPPARSALWIVPNLNPDGVAAGTRVNADGVDLNRNFPWHWRPLGPRGDPQYAGPRALSEPESRAARALILRVRPRITIWFTSPRVWSTSQGAILASSGGLHTSWDFPLCASSAIPGAR